MHAHRADAFYTRFPMIRFTPNERTNQAIFLSSDPGCRPGNIGVGSAGDVGTPAAHVAEVGLVHEVGKGGAAGEAAGLGLGVHGVGVGEDADALAAGLAGEVLRRGRGAAAVADRVLHGADGGQARGDVAGARRPVVARGRVPEDGRRRAGGLKGVGDGEADARRLAPGRGEGEAARGGAGRRRAGPRRGRLEDEVGAVRAGLLHDGVGDDVAKGAGGAAVGAPGAVKVAALFVVHGLAAVLAADVEEDDDGDAEEDEDAADDAADDGGGGGAGAGRLLGGGLGLGAVGR